MNWKRRDTKGREKAPETSVKKRKKELDEGCENKEKTNKNILRAVKDNKRVSKKAEYFCNI